MRLKLAWLRFLWENFEYPAQIPHVGPHVGVRLDVRLRPHDLVHLGVGRPKLLGLGRGPLTGDHHVELGVVGSLNLAEGIDQLPHGRVVHAQLGLDATVGGLGVGVSKLLLT